MEITDVQVRKLNAGKIKGSGSFQYGELKINFTIVEGRNGHFVSLPRHSYVNKENETKWVNDVWIDNEDFRKKVNDVVMASFRSENGTPSNNESNSKPVNNGVPF